MWEKKFHIFIGPEGESMLVDIAFGLNKNMDGFTIDTFYVHRFSGTVRGLHSEMSKALDELFTSEGQEYIQNYYEGKRAYAAERRPDKID